MEARMLGSDKPSSGSNDDVIMAMWRKMSACAATRCHMVLASVLLFCLGMKPLKSFQDRTADYLRATLLVLAALFVVKIIPGVLQRWRADYGYAHRAPPSAVAVATWAIGILVALSMLGLAYFSVRQRPVHGYAYPQPAVRPLTFGSPKWIKDPFAYAGYKASGIHMHPFDKAVATKQMHDLIEALNEEVFKVLEKKFSKRVLYVDLRKIAPLEDDWENDMHLNADKFGEAAGRVDHAITAFWKP